MFWSLIVDDGMGKYQISYLVVWIVVIPNIVAASFNPVHLVLAI